MTTVVPVRPSFANSGSGQEPHASECFRLQRKILLVFGIWPGDRLVRRWYVKVLIIVNLVVLAICMSCEFLYSLYAYRAGNLSEAIESICPTVARVSGFLRMVFYLVNEEKIARVLIGIEHGLRNQHPRETHITKQVNQIGQRYTLGLFLAMFFAALLFGVTPFFIMAYNWHQGQRPLVKLLPFKLALPFDSQNVLYYVLTTLYLNYASAPTITSQAGSDALFSGVCFYVHGQLQGIKLDLEALAGSENGQALVGQALKADPSEIRHVNRQLRRISKRHQRTIELIGDVRAAFTPNVLLVYTCTALILCIVCVAMLVVEGLYKLTYVEYAFSEVVLLFLYSYGGTIIRDSSEAIKTVAYNFPWYRYDSDTRHLIQMMMIRAQYGSNLDVPFFENSMATFSMVGKQIFSFWCH
uniref:Uncharacterized protein n=1 Tax=Anopheles atroparvus TaxID=41427 RepID=A0A182INQ0_ANOAO